MTPDSEKLLIERVPCPACAEPVLPMARKCRYCGEWFGELASWGADDVDVPSQLQNIATLNPYPRDRADMGRTSDVGAEGSDADWITVDDLRVDAFSLEVGPDLAHASDPGVGGELLQLLKDLRRRVALEFGVIAPGVRVRRHAALGLGEYRIRIKGDLVAEGRVEVEKLLGIGADLTVPGLDVLHVSDPVYGTPAIWFSPEHEGLAVDFGLTVFSGLDVVVTHVAELIKENLAELLTREEVAELLNLARNDSPMVVQELVPNMLALGQLRQVLQNLVREQVPIKDLSTILNALADNAVYTKDPHALTEHVRQALGRRICTRYQADDGVLKAFLLTPDAERVIQNAVQLNETGQVLMLDSETSSTIQNNLADALGRHRGEILDPIIVTPPKIRRHVRSLLVKHFSKIVVLSYAEIVPGVQVENLEMIEIGPVTPPPSRTQGAAPDPDYLHPESNGNDDAQDWSW